MTFRRHEQKYAAKLAAESSFMHAESFKVLERVFVPHLEIPLDPRFVWNMDETAVTGKVARRRRCLHPMLDTLEVVVYRRGRV